MDFETILRAAESSEASDVIIKSGGIPAFMEGIGRPAESQVIPSQLVSHQLKKFYQIGFIVNLLKMVVLIFPWYLLVGEGLELYFVNSLV